MSFNYNNTKMIPLQFIDRLNYFPKIFIQFFFESKLKNCVRGQLGIGNILAIILEMYLGKSIKKNGKPRVYSSCTLK